MSLLIIMVVWQLTSLLYLHFIISIYNFAHPWYVLLAQIIPSLEKSTSIIDWNT